MAEITAAMVMKLRDETGLPMMECKKALQETGGDFELAKQKARESGKKIMAMRQDRSTEEGRMAAYATLKPPVGAMIELQVESAPVAKHEDVIALANDLAKQLATGPGAKTPEELWKQPAPSRKGTTLQQWKDEIEGKMREVLRLTRIHPHRCSGRRLRPSRRQERRAARRSRAATTSWPRASPCTSRR